MKDLQNYNTVLRDIGLESIPIRDEAGSYRWSNGQLEILNQDTFNDLFINKGKIAQVDNSLKDLSKEILAFEKPTAELEQEGDNLLSGNREDVRDLQAQLDQFKTSLTQLDKDMLLRGHIPPVPESTPKEAAASPKKSARVTSKEILSFFMIWVIGEVFMTYVQWHTLRDGKGIEDMIVRSISFGVVLFFIHFVGRLFKQNRRPVYMVFLGFSFLMLFTMLLGPLLLNEAYPPLDENSSTTTEWSLQEDTSNVPSEVEAPYSFWVNFYRKNDVLGGIFVFLFFVIMQTFPRNKAKEVEPEHPVPPPETEAGKNQIEERRQYYVEQILHTENRLRKLNEIQANLIAPNTQRLHGILAELQVKQKEITALKKEKDRLLVENDQLLRKLEMHLSRYQTEYLNVLKNDPVKALVVQPSWPTTEDLKAYFKL
ncbi:hypothetical protein QQ008_24520 [Fulvivirgaceae bacterium BMA10]|uniref:Uncharacterized protein n=1 Tax=Splendidivirga corallicola TaxID=3051826 RepID=A0ABT8KUY3_9BACT|nr:hypothetical protein [Fulvivirgaceae bacterium BMA10]